MQNSAEQFSVKGEIQCKMDLGCVDNEFECSLGAKKRLYNAVFSQFYQIAICWNAKGMVKKEIEI